MPVVIGLAIAVRPRSSDDAIVTLLFWGEVAFVVGVVLNVKRLERHQTWRQVLSPLVETGVGYAILLGGLVFLLWGFGLIVKNWQVVGPILLVIGVGVVGLAVALFVLYLVVRVVRVAWKGR